MKTFLLSILFVVVGTCVSQSQSFPADSDVEFKNSSKLTTEIINKLSVDELKNLGLIWGYLKYYHPYIGQGNYNWDFELFRIIPRLADAKPEIRESIIIEWINSLGEYSTTKYRKPKGKVKLEPDFSWITSSAFSNELSKKLQHLKNAKRDDSGYYIDFRPDVGNPVFSHEDGYENMQYTDAGFRLLALYRYWNIIQYFFPNRHLIDDDWKDVLDRCIPVFISASNEVEYNFALLDIINNVHDTHANIWTQEIFNYKGMWSSVYKIRFVEDKAVVVDYYNDSIGSISPLKRGDIIMSVNGKDVEHLVEERLDKYPASNYPTKLRDIGNFLLVNNSNSMLVSYLRDGQEHSATIKTYPWQESRELFNLTFADTCFRMLTNDIAYFTHDPYKNDYLPTIWANISDTKGLVIDLRCYPSDVITYTVGRHLMPKPTEFVKSSKGESKIPGRFVFTTPLKTGNLNPDYYKGKVVIIVNEDTQSAAEFTAMALRVAPNAMVIGSTTAGADGNVSSILLPGGIGTRISGVGIYYPDGRETQRVGIIPDIEVKPTIAGIKEGKDELLEKAVSIIENNGHR